MEKKAKRGGRITPVTRAVIVKLYNSGASVNHICDRIGTSHDTVYKALKATGTPTRRERQRQGEKNETAKVKPAKSCPRRNRATCFSLTRPAEIALSEITEELGINRSKAVSYLLLMEQQHRIKRKQSPLATLVAKLNGAAARAMDAKADELLGSSKQ